MKNVPNQLFIFWLNFNKRNHNLLDAFNLGGNQFSKNSTWNFEWGNA